MKELPPSPLKLKNYEAIRDDDYFSVTTIASMCHVTRRAVNKWINTGQMKAYMVKGCWRIAGSEVKRQIRGSLAVQPYLNYPAENGKYPHFGYLMYLLITTKDNRTEVTEECTKYGLVRPDYRDLEVLWGRMLLMAPKRTRTQLEGNLGLPLNVQGEEFQGWVKRSGIDELFNNNPWPCMNILQDHSDKREQIEVLIWAQVPNKDIVDFMQKRWSFSLTDEQIDFFGRHFYNVCNFSDEDAERFLSKLRGKDAIFNRRLCWRNPSAAKAVLKIPTRVNFEELFHSMAAIAAINYDNYAVGGEIKVPLAQAQATIIVQAHKQLVALEKIKTDKMQIAQAHAQENVTIANSGVVKGTDEPVDIEDLDQPKEEGEKKPDEFEAKAG